MNINADNALTIVSMITGRPERELAEEAILEKWGDKLRAFVGGFTPAPAKEAAPKNGRRRRSKLAMQELSASKQEHIRQAREALWPGQVWRKTRGDVLHFATVIAVEETSALLRQHSSNRHTHTRLDSFACGTHLGRWTKVANTEREFMPVHQVIVS